MSSRVPSQELLAVLEAYATIGSPGLQPIGKAPHYRQIRPQGWPSGLHYEFIRTADAIGVEIHIESAAAASVVSTVEAFARRELPFCSQRLQWDPRWTYGPRLYAKFPLGTPPEKVASAMQALIEMTFKSITLAL